MPPGNDCWSRHAEGRIRRRCAGLAAVVHGMTLRTRPHLRHLPVGEGTVRRFVRDIRQRSGMAVRNGFRRMYASAHDAVRSGLRQDSDIEDNHWFNARQPMRGDWVGFFDAALWRAAISRSLKAPQFSYLDRMLAVRNLAVRTIGWLSGIERELVTVPVSQEFGHLPQPDRLYARRQRVALVR